MNKRRSSLVAILLASLLLSQQACAKSPAYHIHFAGDIVPAEGVVEGRIELKQSHGALRAFDFAAPKQHFQDFSGDGDIERNGDRLKWSPPVNGGTLRYKYHVNRAKASAYDAKLTNDWALFRLDHLFPRASVRGQAGMQGTFSTQLSAPKHWSLQSRYGNLREQLSLPDNARKYERPTGWFIGGEIGVRRTVIGTHNIAIAAPKDQGFRRIDTLAFLRWTVPELVKVFPNLDEQILIVGASEPMWYGGLSGPGSLYLHANLPLISENSTSVLLHELVHLAGLHSAKDGGDWISEGIAEFYSLEVLRRSGAISDERFSASLQSIRKWVERDNGELTDPSRGVNTMAAVLYFHELNQRLIKRGGSLDQVVDRLLSQGIISPTALEKIIKTLDE